MDSINISNLFPSSNNSISSSKNKPLDVVTLYSSNNKSINIVDTLSTNSNKNINNSFNLNKLLTENDDKIKQATLCYKKRFNTILDKVGKAHSFQKKHIICYIPESVYRCQKYNIQDCVNFVESRLRRLFMDTLQLGSNSLFISWENIEENKKKEDADNEHRY